MITKCPLCGSENCEIKDKGNPYYLINCQTYKVNVNIHEEIVDEFYGHELRNKLLNLIVERILREPICKNGNKWVFDYDVDKKFDNDGALNYINLVDALESYPNEIIDKANRILLNLSILYPEYGKTFNDTIISGNSGDKARVYFEGEFNNISGTLEMLVDLGYVSRHPHGYRILAEGWKQIDRLKKGEVAMNQGFIAMEFSERTKQIKKAFIEGITEARYSPMPIDEKSHNNQIIPEIFYEIKRSKFLVLDVTYGNCGAYYEAGYAKALGKPVIVCCRKDVLDGNGNDIVNGETVKLDKPHFDVLQQKMVVWDKDNIDELVKKLRRRIEATVE